MRTILKYIFPVITLVILIVAVWLSHQPGDISGMESSRIAAFLGVSDTFLRSACHYVLFFLITICCGRHFSWIDSGKNAIGAIAGMVVTILLSFVCGRG